MSSTQIEETPAKATREDAPFVEDGRADRAALFLRDIIARMGMRCEVHLEEPGETDSASDIFLQIEGADAGRLIGKKGQTLAALQYLAYRVVNRPGVSRRHVLVDAEGYTARREDTLAAMATRLGKQAVDDGKIITFEPMNPRDRRVVHLALAKFAGVVTQSQGEGEDRRVQIIPVRRLAFILWGGALRAFVPAGASFISGACPAGDQPGGRLLAPLVRAPLRGARSSLAGGFVHPGDVVDQRSPSRGRAGAAPLDPQAGDRGAGRGNPVFCATRRPRLEVVLRAVASRVRVRLFCKSRHFPRPSSSIVEELVGGMRRVPSIVHLLDERRAGPTSVLSVETASCASGGRIPRSGGGLRGSGR